MGKVCTYNAKQNSLNCQLTTSPSILFLFLVAVLHLTIDRLGLDACLRTGTFFFSAGIEQDMGASLPTKLLLFGFGAFILVVVSAVSMTSTVSHGYLT